MRKLAPYIAALSLAGCWDGIDLDKTVGRRVVEDLLYEVEGFGWVYRVAVSERDGPRPYLVLGEYGELKRLDEDINPGVMVEVPESVMAFSLDDDWVIFPEQIRKIHIKV